MQAGGQVQYVSKLSYVSGPRWRSPRELLTSIANDASVKLLDVEESKGLLRTTVYFRVEGLEEQIEQFGSMLYAAAARTIGDGS